VPAIGRRPAQAARTSETAPPPLRTHADHGNAAAAEALPRVAPEEGASLLEDPMDGVSGGSPLPEARRAEFEASLGVDLSDVRVHTGPAAAKAADRVGSRAFAFGRDIVFADGEAPAGELLAHEVAHVAQAGPGAAPGSMSGTTTPGDAVEADADHAAAAMMEGRPASPKPASAGVARKVALWADPSSADAVASVIRGANPERLAAIVAALQQAIDVSTTADQIVQVAIPGYAGDTLNSSDLAGLHTLAQNLQRSSSPARTPARGGRRAGPVSTAPVSSQPGPVSSDPGPVSSEPGPVSSEPGPVSEAPAPRPVSLATVETQVRRIWNMDHLTELYNQLLPFNGATDDGVLVLELNASLPVAHRDCSAIMGLVEQQMNTVRSSMTPLPAGGPVAGQGPISAQPVPGGIDVAPPAPAAPSVAPAAPAVAPPVPTAAQEPDPHQYTRVPVRGVNVPFSFTGPQVSWIPFVGAHIRQLQVTLALDNAVAFLPNQAMAPTPGGLGRGAGQSLQSGYSSQRNNTRNANGNGNDAGRRGATVTNFSGEMSESFFRQSWIDHTQSNLSVVGAGQAGWSSSGGTSLQAGGGARFENTTLGQFNATFNLVELQDGKLTFMVFHFMWDSPHRTLRFTASDGTILQADAHFQLDFTFGADPSGIARSALPAAGAVARQSAASAASGVPPEPPPGGGAAGEGGAAATEGGTAVTEGSAGAAEVAEGSAATTEVVEGARVAETAVETAEALTTGARALRVAGTAARVGLVVGEALIRAIPEAIAIEILVRVGIAMFSLEAYDDTQYPRTIDGRIGPQYTSNFRDICADVIRTFRGEPATSAHAAISSRAAEAQISAWLSANPDMSRADIAANWRHPELYPSVFDALAPRFRNAVDVRAHDIMREHHRPPREFDFLQQMLRGRIEVVRGRLTSV
jgi:hypothetical protein